MSAVFLNGALVEATEARLSPYDRGLLLGDGLFETLRARGGRLFRPEAHLARLEAGAETLGIPLSLSKDALLEALRKTLAANGLARSDAVLRLTVTRGPGPRGLAPPPDPSPTVLIAAEPYRAPESEAATACIARQVRLNERSPLARLKTLNRLEHVLARREASERGADEALMLNSAGRLAEASSANLFAVIEGGLVTPPVAEGALPGVVRRTVLELTRELGIPAREAAIAPEDLSRAEEAFLTNSLIGIRPLATIDGRGLGAEAPGPAAKRVHAAFEEKLAALLS